MDEEADPWGDVEETPAEEAPAAPAEGAEGAPALEGEAAAEGAEAAPEEAPQETRRRDPNRPILCKYFNRKRNLNYSYLYDYRHSYYDDVIKYLDNRGKGQALDLPRPQTWAERALRTYPERIRSIKDTTKDSDLLQTIRSSNQAYYYHTREALNRRATMRF
ncbi:flightin isoform X2 [Neocloeon triangulifer]|uniref:flightin isoform X2 n=1 Tax=Neocloeon triangulifer TaxID=2078957 RepID=UPI00286EE568|nr:flightin isoform X2 [Neocloeon triangulifer]